MYGFNLRNGIPKANEMLETHTTCLWSAVYVHTTFLQIPPISTAFANIDDLLDAG